MSSSLPCLDSFSCCGVNPFRVIVTFPKTLNEQVVRRVKEQVDIVSERQRDLRIRKTELHLDELEETYKCCVCLKAGEYRDAEREEVAVLQNEEEERLKRTLQYRTINLSSQVIQGTTSVASKSTNLVLGGVTDSAKFLGNTTIAVARKTKGGLSSLAHLGRGDTDDLEMTQRSSAADLESGGGSESNLSRVDSVPDMRAKGGFVGALGGGVQRIGGGVQKRVKWLAGFVVGGNGTKAGDPAAANAQASPHPSLVGVSRRKVNLTGKVPDADHSFKLNLASPPPKKPHPKHVSLFDEESSSPRESSIVTYDNTREGYEPEGLAVLAQATLEAQATNADGQPLWDTEAVLRQLPRYYFTNDDKELEAAWKRKKALSTYHKDKGLVRIHDTDHLMLSSFYNKPVRGFLCVECYSAARHRLDDLHRQIELIVLRGGRPFLTAAIMAALEAHGDVRESTRAANALERRMRRELRVGRMSGITPDGVGPREKHHKHTENGGDNRTSRDIRLEAFRRGLHKLTEVDGVVLSDMDRRMLGVLTRTPAYIRSIGMGVLAESVILNIRTHVQCSVCRWRTSTYFQPKAFAFLCHFCCARDKDLRGNCVCINNEPMPIRLVYVLSRLSSTITEKGLVPTAKEGAVQLRRLANRTRVEAKAQRRKAMRTEEKSKVSLVASTSLFDTAEGFPTVAVSVVNHGSGDDIPTFAVSTLNEDVDPGVYAEVLRRATFPTEYGLTPFRHISLHDSRQNALTSLFQGTAPSPPSLTTHGMGEGSASRGTDIATPMAKAAVPNNLHQASQVVRAAHESLHEEPAHEEPVSEDSVHEEPAQEEPVSEDSVHEQDVHEEEPAQEEPVSEDSVHEEPAQEEPVSEDSVYEQHVHISKEPTPLTSVSSDHPLSILQTFRPTFSAKPMDDPFATSGQQSDSRRSPPQRLRSPPRGSTPTRARSPLNKSSPPPRVKSPPRTSTLVHPRSPSRRSTPPRMRSLNLRNINNLPSSSTVMVGSPMGTGHRLPSMQPTNRGGAAVNPFDDDDFFKPDSGGGTMGASPDGFFTSTYRAGSSPPNTASSDLPASNPFFEGESLR